MIYSNQSNDINFIKTIFKNKFNIQLKLNSNYIYLKKHLALGNLNNLDLLNIYK